MNSEVLKEQIAIITGAGQGIGRAIALLFAKEGAKVIVSDVVEESAAATVNDIKAQGGTAISFVCDVSKMSDCENLTKKVIEEFGKIDILVNNAGITRDQLILRMSEEDWDKVILVNLKSVFNMAKSTTKIFLKQKTGCIINMASVVGEIGNAGQANYSASKAGVIGLTKTLAKEFASRGIRVNAIAPGFIRTKMTDAIPQAAKEALMSQIPLGRLGEPEDVANLALFLASPLSGYITGQILRVDGGMVM